jgi:ribosomal protein S18 acetylase RimI-like enzyme
MRELDASLDVAAVTALSIACMVYAMLVNGKPPSPNDGIAFFADIAPGKRLGDMLKLGILDDSGRLVGVVDVVRSHPGERDWYIGLLLLHPDVRGHGAGRAAVAYVDTAAKAAGAMRLVLSVVDDNTAALAFWRRLGFVDVRRLEPRRFGVKTHARYELAREVLRPESENANTVARATADR